MEGWFADNSLTIGRTPLVALNRIPVGGHATILAKIEGRNPAFSVKCRLGAAMIWDAEARGLLGPGKELVEPTSCTKTFSTRLECRSVDRKNATPNRVSRTRAGDSMKLGHQFFRR